MPSPGPADDSCRLREPAALAVSENRHTVVVALSNIDQRSTGTHFASCRTSTSSLTQNYEIEVFWEQSPGRVFHAYGMWREVTVGGFNLTIEDDGFFNLMLTNLIDWDTKTSALCAK